MVLFSPDVLLCSRPFAYSRVHKRPVFRGCICVGQKCVVSPDYPGMRQTGSYSLANECRLVGPGWVQSQSRAVLFPKGKQGDNWQKRTNTHGGPLYLHRSLASTCSFVSLHKETIDREQIVTKWFCSNIKPKHWLLSVSWWQMRPSGCCFSVLRTGVHQLHSV